MFKEFWDKNPTLIKFTGFIIALNALFLNISIPQNQNAKWGLANIQVFSLFFLIVSLTILCFNFVKLLIKTEKRVGEKYDIPVGIFSLTSIILSMWIILSFLVYIFSLYSSSLLEFLTIIFPAIILGIWVLLLVLSSKKRFTLFSEIIINSFGLSALISFAGIYIQQGIIKYFYWYWIFKIFPISFLALFVILLMVVIIQKRKLF